jgi:hypothetical protein
MLDHRQEILLCAFCSVSLGMRQLVELYRGGPHFCFLANHIPGGSSQLDILRTLTSTYNKKRGRVAWVLGIKNTFASSL